MQQSQNSLTRYLKDTGLNQKHNTYVFFICLGISVLLWLLIAFSKESQTLITAKIKIKNVPESLEIFSKSDSIFNISLAGSPSMLFRIKYLKKQDIISIDLENYSLYSKDNYFYYNIPVLSLLNSYEIKYKNRIKVKGVSPEMFKIHLSKMSSKRVPVIPDLNLNFVAQYNLLEEAIVEPDSITINGNEKALRKITSVSTKPLIVNDLNKSGEYTVELINPLPDSIVINDYKTNIKLRVDRFTESQMNIPLQNETGINGLKTFPNSVKLTYLIPLKDYNKISAEMFLVSPETPELSSANKKLKVDIIHQPDFIKMKEIQPDSVNYILIK